MGKKSKAKESGRGNIRRRSGRKVMFALSVPLIAFSMLLFQASGGLAAGWNYMWLQALAEIRTAVVDSQDWYHKAPSNILPWHWMWMRWKGLLGLSWIHPAMKILDLSSLTRPSGAENSFCYDTMSYMWVNPAASGYSYPSIYAGYEDIQEWIKACKASWLELGDEEKALLEPYRAAGKIPLDVSIPLVDNNTLIKMTARAATDLPIYENAEKLTREEIREIMKGSMDQSVYDGQEVPEETLDYYAAMNMRKVIEIPADWTEVGKAIRAGRITKFDARGLLPKELFNISFATMYEWEGVAARRIPIFSDSLLPASFSHFADAKKTYISEHPVKTPITVANEGLCTVNGGPDRLTMTAAEISASDRGVQTGYIHTKRLPVFHKKLPNVEKLMGIDDDVLSSQSMLWLGPTPGGFHYDEEANVYVQLSGYTAAFLVPQNWTDYFTGSQRHPWGSQGLPGVNEVAEEPEYKSVPIYMIPMKPGDGITLHSRTYHRFMAQTVDRVSLNWFFIPGWRRMEYNPSDWYALEAKSSLPRLALRQLWARTFTRLFESTGRGVVYMGRKLEYL